MATAAARSLTNAIAGSESLTRDLVYAAGFALISSQLSVEPSLLNALIRVAIWASFLYFVVQPKFLWQPGPSSWFVIIQAISYGSWVLFYVIGLILFPNSQTFRYISGGPVASIGFSVDTGSFVFLVIAWAIVRCFGP